MLKEKLETSIGIFKDAHDKYGNSFILMSPLSLVDQITSKIMRLRHIEQKTAMRVQEDILDTAYAVINYSTVARAMLDTQSDKVPVFDVTSAFYNHYFSKTFSSLISLYENKNSDYGNIVYEYDLKSIIEIVGSKFLRIKHILQNTPITFDSNIVKKIKSDIDDSIVYMCVYIYRKEKNV